MGQYHYTVNIDKKEYLDPHVLACGLKLWEQAASICGTPAALFVLLAASNGRGGGDFATHGGEVVGRWAGDRIAVVGDYAEDHDYPWDTERHDPPSSVYRRCSEGEYTDISLSLCHVLEAEYGVRYTGNGWRDIKVPWLDGEEEAIV